jgi:head-tail adaptor
MPAAGEYVDRLDWGQRTKGTPDSFGQAVYTFPTQGFLWGVVEEVAGLRVTEMESEKQQTTATIRLRNYPAVAAGDRLTDGLGRVWRILSAVRGDVEVLCEVELE